MADSGAIRAGRAFVELFADDSALARGLRGAQAKLRAFGQSVTKIGGVFAGLGAAVAVPLFAAAKAFSEVGASIHDTSQRTGIGAQALSELGFAAGQAGADLETLEKGVRTMQKGLLAAQSGSGNLAKGLELIGVPLKSLLGLKPEEQFLAIAEGLSTIQDDSTRAAVAMQLFGKSGTQLLPLLSEGADGIEAMREQARRLGVTFSDEAAASADDFDDALTAMTKAVKGIVLSVGGALAPALTQVATVLSEAAGAVSRFVKEHQALVIIAGLGAVALFGLGAAFIVVGTAATGLAAVLGVVASVIGAILSPVGLVVVALVAGVAAFLAFSEAGGVTVRFLLARFSKLKAFVTEVVGGIADALSAGDVRLAAEILWAGVLVAFQTGKASVLKVWIGLKFAMIKAWQDAGFIIAETWQNSMAAIKTAVLSTVDFILDKYLGAVMSIAQAMANVIGFITGQEINVTEDDIAIARIVRPLQDAVRQSRQAIEAENQATLGDLEKAWADSSKRIAKERAAALAGADGGADEARAQLDALIKQAAAAKQAALEERAQRAERAEADRKGLTDLSKQADDLSAQGTFSSVRAASALSVADKTGKKLDDIVGQLKQLNRKADNGLAFGGD